MKNQFSAGSFQRHFRRLQWRRGHFSFVWFSSIEMISLFPFVLKIDSFDRLTKGCSSAITVFVLQSLKALKWIEKDQIEWEWTSIEAIWFFDLLEDDHQRSQEIWKRFWSHYFKSLNDRTFVVQVIFSLILLEILSTKERWAILTPWTYWLTFDREH